MFSLGFMEPILACCCCSFAKSCLTLRNPVNCSRPGFPVLHCLPEFAEIHVHWVGDAIQSSHLLLPPSSLALNLSQHQGLFLMSRLFASDAQSIGASASVSVLPMNTQEWSPRINWLDLLVVEGTLKSLLQHQSLKASILQCSAFFIVPLSHPYMTTGKTIALTRGAFVGKVMSLLFTAI